MKYKIFGFFLMMTSFGELKAQEAQKILMVPSIEKLLTFKSPEDFAKETRNAGYDLKSGGKLEQELSKIKTRFSNQPVFLGIGKSRGIKEDKLKGKQFKVIAEIYAIRDLEAHFKREVKKYNYSNSKRCYDNIYKLILSDKKNTTYVAMIMLQKDTLYNSSCKVEFEIFSSEVYLSQVFSSGVYKTSYDSETSLLFSKVNPRLINLQERSKGNETTILLRDSSKKGELRYTNNGINQSITFTPSLKKGRNK